MSLREELLSSCAKVHVVEMADGFKRAAVIGELDVEKISRRFFMSVWNSLMQSNPMFTNKYNLGARL